MSAAVELLPAATAAQSGTAQPATVAVALLWRASATPTAQPLTGSIAIVHGRLQALTPHPSADPRACTLTPPTQPDHFQLHPTAPQRLTLTVAEPRLGPGANATLVELHCDSSPVTFFLRDVTAQAPIFLPAYGLAVTTADDPRDFAALEADLQARNLRSHQARLADNPETTFAAAASLTRDLQCPTWLGVARDLRLFRLQPREASGYWGTIQPAFHSHRCTLPESGGQPYAIDFVFGPGAGCQVNLTRRLEEGVLPILHSDQREADVHYHLTAFATLETQPLTAAAVRGSDPAAAYAQTFGCMYTADEKAALLPVIARETVGREEELVLCLRVEAVNTGPVPRYAWLKGAHLTPTHLHRFDSATGNCTLASDRVYAVQRLNGRPLPQEELAVLLQPGQSLRLEILVPHQPISAARAARLATLDVDRHHAACRAFWQAKLASAAQVELPEPAIQERLQAGLLHLDLNTLGQEPAGNALACVGWYSPIGSESAPMIQFYDSMGWHALAERCLQFFLDRQRPDGFIQNFGGYQLETGPVLWTAGEHFRYTRDTAWLRRVAPQLLKSCDYLLAWRARNQVESLRGKGYGLIDGKVADPEDFFHSFMLNAVSYLGLARMGEIFAAIDPDQARRLSAAAAAWRADIRTAYFEQLARAPVVPLGDGTWAPSAPNWTENRGALSLFAEPGAWFTHGAFAARDSLIGPLWLGIGEVLDPQEPAAGFLLQTHQELMTSHNAGLSQPYYCRHDWLHLKRGETAAFLATYYHQLTALQDRATYTFWEHYFHVSQHKTHEEAWFLMQTRWMLYLEEGDTLSLLKAIPRAWLAPGRCLRLERIASYFGPLSLTVTVAPDGRSLTATVECLGDRPPRAIALRLPHPDRRLPREIRGGQYDPATETVHADFPHGRAEIVLIY